MSKVIYAGRTGCDHREPLPARIAPRQRQTAPLMTCVGELEALGAVNSCNYEARSNSGYRLGKRQLTVKFVTSTETAA